MKIIVPATSANLGCGFDSVAIAVNLYLEVEVKQKSKKWFIEHHFGEEVPSDESNLMVQTALGVAPHLTPYTLKVTSTIPLARGLGSSSSAIVAGIELACLLANLPLTVDEKLNIACGLEGTPDNSVAAILGGMIVATFGEEGLTYCKLNLPDCALVAYIPGYKILTAESRRILPAVLPYAEAVRASSIANVMLCALSSGDIITAGKMMERDLFHEKYRESLFPELARVRPVAKKCGAYATCLSGAGSTIFILIEKGKEDRLISVLNEEKEQDTQIVKLEQDIMGTRVER